MESLGKAVVTSMLIVASTLLKGWVLTKLWVWFIVSTFGVNPLRIVEAIGISIIIGLLTYKMDRKTHKEDTEETKYFGDTVYNTFKSMLLMLLYLLMGYIVQLF